MDSVYSRSDLVGEIVKTRVVVERVEPNRDIKGQGHEIFGLPVNTSFKVEKTSVEIILYFGLFATFLSLPAELLLRNSMNASDALFCAPRSSSKLS